jgi:hypothetical protein
VLDHRVQGTIGVIRRTAQCHSCCTRAADLLGQHLYQPRLANACFAAEEHHLAATVHGLCPTVQQEPDL